VLWVGKERVLLPHHVAVLYVNCLWRELIQSTVELRCEHACGIALRARARLLDLLVEETT